MAYGDVPEFIGTLRVREAVAALALEFLILTAARSGEVLGARWDEINLEGKVWTVPPARMKAGREHRVPLSSWVVAMLEKLSEARTSNFVFPGQRAGKPLSAMAMEMVLRRMKLDGATVHGFRSAFRDWAGTGATCSRESDAGPGGLFQLASDRGRLANPRNGTSYKKKPEIRNRIQELLEEKTLHLEINIANLTKIYFSTYIEATAAKQHSAAKGCLDSLAKLHGLTGEKETAPASSGLTADERRILIAALEGLESPANSGAPPGNS
jgi:hypothetical protein